MIQILFAGYSFLWIHCQIIHNHAFQRPHKQRGSEVVYIKQKVKRNLFYKKNALYCCACCNKADPNFAHSRISYMWKCLLTNRDRSVSLANVSGSPTSPNKNYNILLLHPLIDQHTMDTASNSLIVEDIMRVHRGFNVC